MTGVFTARVIGTRTATAFRWRWTARARRHSRRNSFHAESLRPVVQGGVDRELRDPPGLSQGSDGAAFSEFFPGSRNSRRWSPSASTRRRWRSIRCCGVKCCRKFRGKSWCFRTKASAWRARSNSRIPAGLTSGPRVLISAFELKELPVAPLQMGHVLPADLG